MTKKQAVKEFKEHILPIIKRRYEKDGRRDIPARREAWSTYIDCLIKDGMVTMKAARWSQPDICK